MLDFTMLHVHIVLAFDFVFQKYSLSLVLDLKTYNCLAYTLKNINCIRLSPVF